MGKQGMWAVPCPAPLSLGTAVPIGDTHVLSSMELGPFSASYFYLGRNA